MNRIRNTRRPFAAPALIAAALVALGAATPAAATPGALGRGYAHHLAAGASFGQAKILASGVSYGQARTVRAAPTVTRWSPKMWR